MNNTIRFGCQIATYGDVEKTIKYGLIVEKYGLDVISVPDHLFHPPGGVFKEPAWDAYVVLSALGVKTSKARLMTISDTVRKHPAVLANEVSTLDQLTNGRFNLALGAGELFNFEPIKDILWDRPFTRYKEAIEVLKGLWLSTKNEPFNFNGRYFKIENGFLGLKPVQRPHPPLYIAGYGPKMKKLAAAVGNGWFTWMHSPRALEQEVSEIKTEAEKCGRSLKDIDIAVIIPTAISDDSEKAWEAVAPRVKGSLPMRARLLKQLNYEELASEAFELLDAKLSEETIDKISSLSRRIPDEIVREVSIAGTPDEAIEQVDRFRKAGVTLFILLPMIQVFEQTIKAYGEKIIPYFKE